MHHLHYDESCIQVSYTALNENPLSLCQYRGDVASSRDVQDYMQGVRGNVAYGQFVWPACRRSLSRLTQSRAMQIGIDGEHRPFRIIPALSVTKRASTNDFTPDLVGAAVLFVSVPTTWLLHILHLSSGTHFFIPLRPEVPLKKKRFRQCS